MSKLVQTETNKTLEETALKLRRIRVGVEKKETEAVQKLRDANYSWQQIANLFGYESRQGCRTYWQRRNVK